VFRVPVEAQASSVGQWSNVYTWPYRPIHAQLLPNNKILFWDSYNQADNPYLYSVNAGTVAAAPHAGYNIFCTGFSFLADGRLLVVGGHIANDTGLATTAIYDSVANTWTRQADMAAGRWYPSAITLANGDVLVVSGMVDPTTGANVLPQVWTAATSSWRNLTSAQLAQPYYPYMFLAPNGQVFDAGPSQLTRFLDTTGTGAWTAVGTNTYGTRNWGSAAMYEPGRILLAGGEPGTFYNNGSAVAPTNTTETIDLTAASPAWTPAAPLAYARKHHNLTILPDGTVLATGGSSGSEPTNSNSTNPALAAEMWNPASNTWTTMASNTVYRGYHAIALLLPDGRVLSGGGDWGGPTYELFSPPYLFKGARPSISSAPATVGYGQNFSVSTPDAANVTQVTWLRIGAVTHTFNMNQRFNRLSFTAGATSLTVTAPANGNLAPPGHYLLFLLNSAGVPSVGRFIRLVAPAATPTPTGSPAATSTPTPTPALTPTPTAPPMATPTPSASPTPPPTGAPSATPTRTPTVTPTLTSSPVPSSTPTRTRTATPPPSATLTPPSTSTPTAAPTVTGTLPPTSTPTLPPTATSTVPPTSTSTAPPTSTSTFTATRTGTTTFTPTPTRTFTRTPTGVPTATPTPSIPAKPSNLAATAISSTQIDLTWHDNSSNEDGFKIERCAGNNCQDFAQIAQVGANVTTFSDTGLTHNVKYGYRVRAFNVTGNSPYSNIVRKRTL